MSNMCRFLDMGAYLASEINKANLATVLANSRAGSWLRLDGTTASGAASVLVATSTMIQEQVVMAPACGIALIFFLIDMLEKTYQNVSGFNIETLMGPFLKLIVTIFIISKSSEIANIIATASDRLLDKGMSMLNFSGDADGYAMGALSAAGIDTGTTPTTTAPNAPDAFAVTYLNSFWPYAGKGGGASLQLESGATDTFQINDPVKSIHVSWLTLLIPLAKVWFLNIIYTIVCFQLLAITIKRFIEFYLRTSMFPLAFAGIAHNGSQSMGFRFVLETAGVGLRGLLYVVSLQIIFAMIGAAMTSGNGGKPDTILIILIFTQIGTTLKLADDLSTKILG